MNAQPFIIVGGKAFPCAVPVYNWVETGFHFTARMRLQTRWIINHWTASENSAEQIYQSMRGHKNADGKPEPLSVHFIVDALGAAYQCMDADARGAHCRGGNGNSYGVGIEIVNRGHDFTKPSKGIERPRRTDRVHGQLIAYGEFLPAQIATVVALNRALCNAYELPLRMPMKDGDVYATTMPDAYRDSYRGCGGHYHFERGKVDPAIDILRRIHAAGLDS